MRIRRMGTNYSIWMKNRPKRGLASDLEGEKEIEREEEVENRGRRRRRKCILEDTKIFLRTLSP